MEVLPELYSFLFLQEVLESLDEICDVHISNSAQYTTVRSPTDSLRTDNVESLPVDTTLTVTVNGLLDHKTGMNSTGDNVTEQVVQNKPKRMEVCVKTENESSEKQREPPAIPEVDPSLVQVKASKSEVQVGRQIFFNDIFDQVLRMVNLITMKPKYVKVVNISGDVLNMLHVLRSDFANG